MFIDIKLNLFTFKVRGVAEVVWTGVTTDDNVVWSSNYIEWYGDQPDHDNGTNLLHNDPVLSISSFRKMCCNEGWLGYWVAWIFSRHFVCPRMD